MPSPADEIAPLLTAVPDPSRVWLVTGAAGFIGSHLVESLLALNERVIGLDNFATGSRANLAEIEENVSKEQWQRFRFIDADVRDASACRDACRGVTIVLHQAALGSVPRSIDDPLATHAANVTGHLNMLIAAKDASVSRFVYASSSSVYGDSPSLPQTEDRLGRPLSPYAAGKHVAELYADVCSRCYHLPVIGLRYFNVFGPRQNADGPYAGVIPRWTRAMLAGEPVVIYGDGTSSRDFCFVHNVVQANILAALTSNSDALGGIFNIATGAEASLNTLYSMIADRLNMTTGATKEHRPPRPGDLRHSRADISRARNLLGYSPTADLAAGLDATVAWHRRRTRSCP